MEKVNQICWWCIGPTALLQPNLSQRENSHLSALNCASLVKRAVPPDYVFAWPSGPFEPDQAAFRQLKQIRCAENVYGHGLTLCWCILCEYTHMTWVSSRTKLHCSLQRIPIQHCECFYILSR